MNGSYKLSSLLRYGNNKDSKKFYSTGPRVWNESEQNFYIVWYTLFSTADFTKEQFQFFLLQQTLFIEWNVFLNKY